MATNFVQKGEVINFVTNGAVVSGAVVKINDLIGIAQTAASASGQTITVALEGVFNVKVKAADVVAQGNPLYWDATNSEMTLTETDNTFAGYAFTASAASVSSVHIKLAASNYQVVTP